VGAFRDALKAAYPNATYTVISADQLDILSDDLQAAKAQKVQATPESLAAGQAILAAAVKASGGDSLKAVQTIALTEAGVIHAQGGERARNVKWQVVYPDKSFGEVDVAGQTVQQVCNGTTSWLKFPNSVRDTSDVTSEFKRGIAFFGGGWGFYRQVLDGKIQGSAIDGADIDGHKTQGVAVDGDFGSLKLYFDATTHLLAAARFDTSAEQGVNHNEQRWSDYRPVDGVSGALYAYTTVTYREGTKFFDSTTKSVTINPKVDPAVFVKPSN
jgi:hypothetical protein